MIALIQNLPFRSAHCSTYCHCYSFAINNNNFTLIERENKKEWSSLMKLNHSSEMILNSICFYLFRPTFMNSNVRTVKHKYNTHRSYLISVKRNYVELKLFDDLATKNKNRSSNDDDGKKQNKKNCWSTEFKSLTFIHFYKWIYLPEIAMFVCINERFHYYLSTKGDSSFLFFCNA